LKSELPPLFKVGITVRCRAFQAQPQTEKRFFTGKAGEKTDSILFRPLRRAKVCDAFSKNLVEFRRRSGEIRSSAFSGATCACQKTLLAPPVCPQGARRGVQSPFSKKLAFLKPKSDLVK